MLGIYVHFAICKKRCKYCDFNSSESIQLCESYTEALLQNIDNLSIKYNLKNKPADTIYFGGGTPSVFSNKQLFSVLEKLHSTFKITNNAEISIEANPESLNIEKLAFYNKNGFNRISIGVQSFEDSILKELGRLHSLKQAMEIIDLAQEYFPNLSLDLMFGLPGQTKEIYENSLNIVGNLEIPHISAYLLTQGKKIVWKENELPHENIVLDFLTLTKKKLNSCGIHQYEISNYSKPGYECKHNIKYWKNNDYIGFGAGAHSFLDKYNFEKNKNSRFELKRSIDVFINTSKNSKIEFEMFETPNEWESKFDFITNNLRLNQGLSEADYYKKYNSSFLKTYKPQIRKNLALGNINISNENIALTDRGRLYSNLVFEDFLI